MSYLSSVSSTFIKPSPSTLVAGAVGSRIIPAINTNAVGSADLLQPIAAVTIPKGVWLLSGVLTLACQTGGSSLFGNVGIALDANVVCRFTIANQVLNIVSIPLSYSFISDGTDVLTIPTTFETTAGDYAATTATAQTSIVLTCIA